MKFFMTEYNGYSNAMTDVFTSQFQVFDSLVSSLVYWYFYSARMQL